MGKGAPTKYLEVYNDQVYKLCLLGATDKEIADFFNVCEATINNWKNEHPSFLESIKAGKQIADYNVVNRLYQRALGFEHDSEEIKIVEGSIERVPIKKIYPPDPTSAIFWLKNRQPAKWRDKQEVEQTGSTPQVTIFQLPDNGRK
ncbi:terminase [Elizabethkingia anophelis]|nr:terminase [Elizabethkingia anophelis]